MSQVSLWIEISKTGGIKAVNAFRDIWYNGKELDKERKAILKPLFEKYPLGQTDIKVWVKQRMRQIFENSLREK